MKHIRKFNESFRDDLKSQVHSSFEASGSLKEHEESIKNDILSYVDELLDDEVEIIIQMAKLQKGEISQDEVDVDKMMKIGEKFNRKLMDIIKVYFRGHHLVK